MEKRIREVPATEFKAHCLALMDQIQQTRGEIVVTKHGRPVARLVPYEPSSAELFGLLAGTTQVHGDLAAPVDVTWDVDVDAVTLLLDTHVWIWALEGDRSAIGRRAREAIAAASAEGGLGVAAISVWEVAMLEARGRLRLSLGVDEWVRRGLAAPGVRLIPLLPDIAIESANLPGAAHGEPADRLIVATARRLGATLATRDRAILDYGAEGHVRVLDASR